MSFDEASAAVAQNALAAPAGSHWLHKKTNGRYVVRMHVLNEADLVPCVIYQQNYGDETPTWSRPAVDFLDGRFARLPDTPQ